MVLIPTIVWQLKKKLDFIRRFIRFIGRFRGSEGVKGAKVGLLGSHCDLLDIINAFNIDQY